MAHPFQAHYQQFDQCFAAARRTRLAELQSAPGTQVFYAPPHSLQRVLSDMVEVLGGSRRVCVARELTKVHEELYRCASTAAWQVPLEFLLFSKLAHATWLLGCLTHV